VQESKENVERNKVERLVTIRRANLFETELNDASVVTLYLLHTINTKLLPRFQKLKPGTRIVAHSFDLRGVKPDRVVKIPMDEKGFRTIYLYVTPLKLETPPAPPPKPSKKATGKRAARGEDRGSAAVISVARGRREAAARSPERPRSGSAGFPLPEAHAREMNRSGAPTNGG
jgi:hypothetical protein